MRFAFAFGVLLVCAAPAFALSVEPDQPGFRDERTNLAAAARAAEGWSHLSADMPTAKFTGAEGTFSFKRKAFPPGYGRSGYQFADELEVPKADEKAPQPAKAEAPPQASK